MKPSTQALLLAVVFSSFGCSWVKEDTARIVPASIQDKRTKEQAKLQEKTRRGMTGNPVSYDLKGRTYFVLPTSKGFVSEGLASWYGPGFHGHETANGEIYDMHGLSAAHKTLPIPCKVRVTNLGNGKQIDLRINDRGPYYHDREIDLSLGAAKALDMDKLGTAKVKVEAIDNNEEPDRYYVQVSAYRKTDRAMAIAEAFRKRLERDRIAALLVEGREYYTLEVGPMASIEEISAVKDKLGRFGIKELFYTHIN